MQTIQRKLMCENTKFNVYFEHIVDAVNKLEVKDFLVVEPKVRNSGGISGVALLPIRARQVGLIKMYRPPIKGWSLEIPHGFIEQGEDELVSAERELLEETGLVSLSITPLGIVAPDAGVIDGRVQLYACLVDDGLAQITPEVGLRELIWMDFEDFEQMLCNSEIQDSFTISAWCKYKLKCRV